MDPRNFDPDLMSEMLSAMGKELKLARAKIQSLESQDFKKRAESAEYALGVMKKNFEDVCIENRRLHATLEELRDCKENTEGVNQAMGRQVQTIHDEKSVSTDPADNDYVQDLQQALEMYYQKYRSQKDSKNQIRETCRELEENVLKLKTEMSEQKRSKEKEAVSKVSIGVQTPKSLNASPVVPSAMTRQSDVHKFMSSLPRVSNPIQVQKLKPVCSVSMDLKAFLAEDPRCKEYPFSIPITDLSLTGIKRVGTNLLCLPGRIVRCSPVKQHALAVAPRYTYNLPKQALLENKAAFNGLYGKTFHLFYSFHESIYYAGFYKALDLRSKVPEGISMTGADLSWKAIAETTLGGISSPQITRVFATLYREGLLKVEVLGLQCIDCDMNIYDMLTCRFASIKSAMNPVGKLGGYYPETMQGDEPKKKKQKIVF